MTANIRAAILVWRWSEAPEKLKALVGQVTGETADDAADPHFLLYEPAGNTHTLFWSGEPNSHTRIGMVDGNEHPFDNAELVDDQAIVIFQFSDVPPDWRKAILEDGDEDWIGRVPAHLVKEPITFMKSGTAFGLGGVRDVKLPGGNGAVLRVGNHS